MLEFATFAEAQAAGYRRCHETWDRDVSSDGSRGYHFEAVVDGRESVTVRLTDEPNAGRTTGCYAPMMPLIPGMTEEQERHTAQRLIAEELDRRDEDAERETRAALDEVPA